MKLMLAVAATGLALAAALAWPRSRPTPVPIAEPPAPTVSQAPASAATTSAPVPSVAPAPEAVPVKTESRGENVIARLRQALADGDLEAIARLRKELLDLITPSPVPDDRNGALVYLKAFPLIAPLDEGLQLALAALKAGGALPAQLAALEAYLAANASGLALLREAAAYDRCRYPIALEDGFNTRLTHIPELRKAAKALDVEAAVAAAKGLDAEGSRRTLAKLADSLKDEPVLVSQLVRCSCLQEAGGADPATLRPIWRDVMYAELTAAIHLGQTEMAWGSLALPEIRRMAERYLDFVAESADLVVRPWHENHVALEELLRRTVDSDDPDMEGVRYLAPSFAKITTSVARAEARCAPPVDPFTGRAFLEKDGVLYSPGPDLVDDGGDPEKDVVLKPRPAK